MNIAFLDDQNPRLTGAGLSLLLHAVMIALLVAGLDLRRRGGAPAALPKAIQITMAPAHASQLLRPVPPKPPEPPKPLPKPVPVPPTPTDLPKPTPAASPSPPQPSKKPPPPSAASATPKPPGATTTTQTPAPPTPAPPTPEESLIGRIHENWLEPVSTPKSFRCAIRIDYLAGGQIAAVRFLSACGSYDLEQSVRKAIWKTQPLPLLAAKTAAGSIDIEFTP